MDGRLSVDISAVIADPPCRVEHEEYDCRVSVIIGSPQSGPPPINLLQLWFKNPATVLELGRELTSAGMRLAAQLATTPPESADSGQVSDPEEYPVPNKKHRSLEPGESE